MEAMPNEALFPRLWTFTFNYNEIYVKYRRTLSTFFSCSDGCVSFCVNHNRCQNLEALYGKQQSISGKKKLDSLET